MRPIARIASNALSPDPLPEGEGGLEEGPAMSTSNDLPLATWDVPLRAGVQSPCPSPWLCSSLALKDILACPVCAAQTVRRGSTNSAVGSFLLCEGCGAVYPLRHGVPNFIPPSALLALPDDLLAAWQITQQEALPDYRANDPASCSVPRGTTCNASAN